MSKSNDQLLEDWGLKLPLIAAPMFTVSGPALVSAACRAGIIGSFPTVNCRTVADLHSWLAQIEQDRKPGDAPYAVNMVMRKPTLQDELACVIEHKVKIVISSVGSPTAVLPTLKENGCIVLSDVASVHHARRAVEAGVDGLILLSAGAGGQTGWANGLAFARAVREFYDGIIVLAGGISDAYGLLAAKALGCDLAYMGTRFIAAEESLAHADYRKMLLDSSLDDIMLTDAVSGLNTSVLKPSLIAAGFDPDNLPPDLAQQGAQALYSGKASPARWLDIWSAGHSISGVSDIAPVASIVDTLIKEYAEARQALLS